MDYQGETILTYEYPEKWKKGMERYYPDGDVELYKKYVSILKERYPNIILGGRIGLYKYMNMDETIETAMDFCNKIIK
jgi:UDP-galactopyranose mutase